MLYLPLYDGVDKLEIGIDPGAEIVASELNSPNRENPIVMYGTSILQGASASRPGMAATNIIGRRFDREVVNLGFSANAFLDKEIAELMSEVEASAYVLDFVPNASVSQIKELTIPFYRILRKKTSDNAYHIRGRPSVSECCFIIGCWPMRYVKRMKLCNWSTRSCKKKRRKIYITSRLRL